MTLQGETLAARAAAEHRRADLFREAPAQTLRRLLLGCAWPLKPERIGGLPNLCRLWLADLINPATALPDPSAALTNPAGLCGIAHDLSVPTLVDAYRRGLYPFAHVGPVKWWSPPERCLLPFDEFHISRRLRSHLRQERYQVTFDRDFCGVMKACAAPRDGKWQLTWITPKIMRAYADLHDAGFAHSFEVWNDRGELVGGGYGVAVGRTFTIESRFVRASNTSKIGLAVLNWHLARWGFAFIDNKGATQNVLEMGFRMLPRAEFCALLSVAATAPSRVGCWRAETDLKTVADWHPARQGPDPEAQATADASM
jgi:leucyl/phenylalanyl-tRNA--protein transferase